MNAINIIFPYKEDGVWMFDDVAKDLSHEPFVFGADDVLDVLTRNINNAEKGFCLLFSANEFPLYTECFTLIGPESGGHIYYSHKLKMFGWLCPALMKYFDEAPKELYVKLSARKETA